MDKLGRYIYGIIPHERPLPAGSFEAVHLTPEMLLGPYGIMACEEVYTISYQDISAVVSDSEVFDTTRMSKETLARLLLRHQKVIEKIMELNYTIIPMRLATFACDEAEIKRILHKGQALIKGIFEKINNAIEIDLVVTWSDFASVLKEIGEEQEIKELKERLSADPQSITIDDQMKVGAMVKDCLDKKRENISSPILASLSEVHQDIRVQPLMDDKMVAHFAFLLSKSAKNDFYKGIDGLNIQFGEKLNFRCVGPLPPYSFYTLEIKKMEFKDLDWARQKLGLLKGMVDKDEIKKAYYRQAFSTHPDKNLNVPGVGREFDEATKAYKALMDYCLAVEETGRGENFDFNEEEFKKNAVLIKVRG